MADRSCIVMWTCDCKPSCRSVFVGVINPTLKEVESEGEMRTACCVKVTVGELIPILGGMLRHAGLRSVERVGGDEIRAIAVDPEGSHE